MWSAAQLCISVDLVIVDISTRTSRLYVDSGMETINERMKTPSTISGLSFHGNASETRYGTPDKRFWSDLVSEQHSHGLDSEFNQAREALDLRWSNDDEYSRNHNQPRDSIKWRSK